MDDGRWAWVDTASGLLMGAFSGGAVVLGWFNAKLAAAQKRSDAQIDALHSRINSMQRTASDQAASIAVLEAQRKAEADRLERIEGALDAVNKKQDQQMQILLDLARRK